MATGELIQLGRKEIASTDLALVRAQKVISSPSTAKKSDPFHCFTVVPETHHG